MSIQWGAWSSTKGMSSKNPLVLNRVKRLGFGILSPNVAFKTLSKFVMASHGDMSDIIVISPLDIVLMKAWMLEDVFHDEFTAPKQCKSKISSSPLTVPEKKKAGTEVSHIKVEELQNQICDLVEAALGYRIDIQTSLIEAGIDSLGAVELRNSILNLCENQDFRIDSLPAAFVYDFPTISAISQFLIKKASIYGENKQLNDTRTKQKIAQSSFVGLENIFNDNSAHENSEFVCSLSTVFVPGDRRRMCEVYDIISCLPRSRLCSNFASQQRIRFGGILPAISEFDASLYRINDSEAFYIDPQHRKLLDLALSIFLNSSASKHFRTSSHAVITRCKPETSVAVGISGTEYLQQVRLYIGPAAYTALGTFLSVACGRISYSFGLKGPSFCVDTACSSAIVALHLIVIERANVTGNTVTPILHSQAMVAGSNVTLHTSTTDLFSAAGMLALDGRCKALDVAADGYVRSEACLASFVKRNDRKERSTSPLIVGTAINQDGRSATLAAPSGQAQQRLLKNAICIANISGDEMNVVKLHGTGTSLGDPIELSAVIAVYHATECRSIPMIASTPKSCVGHTEPASGALGVASALNLLWTLSGMPSLHLRTINTFLGKTMMSDSIGSFRQAACVVKPWSNIKVCRAERISPIASTSAFAFQGTNGHAIIARHAGRDTGTSSPLWHMTSYWVHPCVDMVTSTAALTDKSRWVFRISCKSLDNTDYSYFWDHRIAGIPIFPAAGFSSCCNHQTDL